MRKDVHIGLLALLMLWGCNLGFDPSQYAPLESTEDSGGLFSNNGADGAFPDVGEACRDNDNDGFINSPNCTSKDR
ncbi:MAG: hypothetical protein AAFS10_20815, partial [Myxococcota bacterium]